MYSWNNISSVNRIETQFRSVANGLASRRADEDKMTTYSNKKMRENLGKSIDEKKLQTMMELKRAYSAGEITLEEGRKRAKAELGTLEPYEFAVAEQGQQSLDPDECRKEDIQAMIDLFSDVLSTKRPELPADHPLSHYYQENDTLRGILKEIEDLVQYPLIKNQWLELYDRLEKYKIHFSRKQNQLYSALERHGFDRPTDTMWLLDDFIRDEINKARSLLDADKDDEFIAMQQTIVDDLRDLMAKEETILYPTSLALIPAAEFEQMKAGDREIGYAWGQTAQQAEPVKAAPEAKAADGDLAADLAALLAKYGHKTASPQQTFDVSTGNLTLDQINLIYRHLPVDITYVDENEIVRFYSDTKHRVFPRSKNVIGRQVQNCHPRTSVFVVMEIIEKFRSGEQSKAEFWINKPGQFIYIIYVAVRDAEGKFRGVLEMMQDCTKIREMQGSRTLLNWENSVERLHQIQEPEAPARQNPAAENAAAAPSEGAKTVPEITAETYLKDLIKDFPALKERMARISPKFKLLQTPLARVMLPHVKIADISARSGMEVSTLIAAIKEQIEGIIAGKP